MVFRVNLQGVGEGNFQKLGESRRVWVIFWGGRSRRGAIFILCLSQSFSFIYKKHMLLP